MSTFSKTSLFYGVMRVYSNFIYKRWFSSIEVNGENNIPEGEPVIFAPNHQNAFIDAMALLSTSPAPIVFWVRADLFSNKIIGAILRSLKMMPAFRLRNGFSNLKKNEASMEDSVDVLVHNQFLCLMPEGGQEERRCLRPLVKGIFRSAFAAQDKIKNDEWVKIIPVGIDYGNYDKSGRHLVLNYGKPINVKDYYMLSQENAPVALNKIKEELYNRISPLMLNIQSTDYYKTFYIASYLYNSVMLDHMNFPDNETNRLVARKEVIDILERAEADNAPELPELKQLCQQWDTKHEDTAFSSKVLDYEGVDADLFIKIFYLILTIPLFLYSILFNGIPFLICKFLASKTKGSGFESSVKLGAAGVLFPIFYLIQILIFAFSFAYDTPTIIAFFFSLPISFFFLLRYRWKFQFVKERLSNIFHKPVEPQKIISVMQRLVSTYKKK